MRKNDKHAKFPYTFNFHEHGKVPCVWKSFLSMVKFSHHKKIQKAGKVSKALRSSMIKGKFDKH